MDEQRFWALVEQSRERSGGDLDEQVDALADLLADLDAAELASFKQVLVAASQRLNTRDHEAAAKLMCVSGGYLGDDSFTDFRSWIIAHGRAVYELVLSNPDSLAELDMEQGIEELAPAEMFAAVADDLYEEQTGRESHEDGVDSLESLPAPAGAPHPENAETYRALFPRLSSRYLR